MTPLKCILISFALVACLAARGAEVAVLDPDDVARIRIVMEVAVSPDGEHLAWVRSVPRRPGVDDDGEPWAELWLTLARGGPERPFITGKVNVRQLTWTPDGKAIAFLAKRGEDKTTALYTIPVDGGEARRALALKTDVTGYSFAPDGVRVAVLAMEEEAETVRQRQEKGFKARLHEEDWRSTQVWIGSWKDVDHVPKALTVTGSVRRVAWNPVDDLLAVAVTPTPSVDHGLMRQRLRLIDPEGQVRSQVDHEGKLEEMVWSPDGKRLAFIAGEDLHDPSAGRLFVVPSTGGRPVEAVRLSDADVSQVAWSDPGRLLMVMARGVQTILGEVSTGIMPGNFQPLVEAPGPVIIGLSRSAHRPVVGLVAHRPQHPPEVYAWRAGEPDLARRTDSNPWLAERRLAVQEVVRHRARDGLDLEGILIRPLEPLAAGVRAPLILSVHGGPEAHVSDGWLTSYSLPGQVAAARGFAVFYPNYRGSTGRGVAFSKLGQGDAAGREFDDLVDAVDHLIQTGLVDRQKVGVTGGSYGGYATAWCGTRYSDRFAAGVMFVGIANKLSKFGTTDIPEEEVLVHARKWPWDDWNFMIQRSPVFHAGQSRTPMLILHGADDPRVHPAQSMEMYRHLKLRSAAPVRLVMYPGEGHGNRRAASRYDYHHRMLQWFEHYLQGPGGAMPAGSIDGLLPKPEQGK